MEKTPAPAAKPVPALEGLAGEFYAWCQKGELRFQRCRQCGRWRHVPREMCPACGSWEWEWERSSGRGRVFTWTVVVRPLHPAFRDEAPYAPAVIEMEEGVRVLSTVIDCSPAELQIGMPVEVVFEPGASGVVLPKFRRARARGSGRE